jgi:mannitol-1-phosphate/altronate dehydrogenase
MQQQHILDFIKIMKYIWETCKDSSIKLITFKALLESSIALSIEHNYPLKELIEHANDLIYRFGNRLLGDTVARVGRDPVRKLSKNDRLIGAAKLCMKNGINPVYIAIGIAAGYAFSSENDTSAEEISKTIGMNLALIRQWRKYSNVRNDWPLFSQVIEFYEMLKSGKPLEYIEKEAEKIKINHKYID